MSSKDESILKVVFSSFFEALFNIIIFLPYYFSVGPIFMSLFSPWKNMVVVKMGKGFSFSEWFNRFSFNGISRLLGFTLRASLLIVYLFAQVLLMIMVPAASVLFFFLLPFLYIMRLASKSQSEKYQLAKKTFLQTHLLHPENEQKVAEWFEQYYNNKLQKSQWWKLINLLSVPPLARNWSTGYTPTLDKFSKDLTDVLYDPQETRIIGREKELSEIERALSKSEEANVILVGDSGVGKHTVLNALAKRIYEGKINRLLIYRRLLYLDMEKILAERIDQKQREEFLEELFIEAKNANNVILIIDSFEKYITTVNNHIDLSTPIEKFAQSSATQLIALTTPSLYQKIVLPHERIHELFTKIDIGEPSKEITLNILLNINFQFEKRFNISIPYETLVAIIEKSAFYIIEVPFPEKAIQLLDEVCVYTVQTLQKKQAMPNTVDTVLTEKTHISTNFSDSMKKILLHLETLLKKQVLFQDQAAEEIANCLRKDYLLLEKRTKPLATLLFLGPTGVGKTETAKAIARIFFNSEDKLIRFDMSNYQSKEQIPQLIGSGEDGNVGLLTKALHIKPYGVLLLDEIEKADKSLINIFLTILDEGYFTDGSGKTVNCKNFVIVATSNAGTAKLYSQSATPAKESMMAYLIEQHVFEPEFLNRFDEIILFNKLDKTNAIIIAEKMLKSIAEQLYSIYKIRVSVNQNTLGGLVDKHYHPLFGARDLERLLRKEVEDKISKLLLEQKVQEGEIVTL